jgi:CoA:oxalate CoA-transferase
MRHLGMLGGAACELEIDGDGPGGDELAQARSGLVAEHGGRLGLPVPSSAAAILAAQGTLAVQLARRRGLALTGVRTSVLNGALLFLSHRIPIATAAAAPPTDPELTAAGPPFATADGAWAELEVLRFGEWVRLWTELGVRDAPLDAAWSSFALRYLTGRCTLAPELHAATRRRSLDELRAVAGPLGVVVARLRTKAEVEAADYDSEPWTFARTGRRPPPTTTAGDLPLAGLRVVEVATRLQGPLAGLLLRRLGADVVKVEPPGGDLGRTGGSPFGRAAYLAYNRSKEVVELDLKATAGRAALRELAGSADVFLHNSRPGRAEQSGYGAAELTAVNPGLVYAHASGWGDAADAPSEIAGDYVVQAHTACGESLRLPGEPPFPSRVTLVDVTGGLLACEGILAALLWREQDGHGRIVRTSLLAAALELQRHTPPAPRPYRGRVCTDLRALPDDPLVAPLLEQIDDSMWAPAAPWRFRS